MVSRILLVLIVTFFHLDISAQNKTMLSIGTSYRHTVMTEELFIKVGYTHNVPDAFGYIYSKNFEGFGLDFTIDHPIIAKVRLGYSVRLRYDLVYVTSVIDGFKNHNSFLLDNTFLITFKMVDRQKLDMYSGLSYSIFNTGKSFYRDVFQNGKMVTMKRNIAINSNNFFANVHFNRYIAGLTIHIINNGIPHYFRAFDGIVYYGFSISFAVKILSYKNDVTGE